jgi:microcystin-dependent protein
MTIVFPSSPAPSNGDLSPDGRYIWQDNRWVGRFSGLAPVHIGAAPPADPIAQPFWYDTGDALLRLLYDDGGGPDWVEASPPATPLPAEVLPPGMVMHRAAVTAPSGWLVCDGSAVSRATYGDLFTAIGTTFGVGDGVTTFNLPDGRGQFIRGFADGVGIDAARTFGTTQADETRSHTHAAINGSASLALGSYSTNLVAANTIGGTETRPSNIALTMMIKT